ncbi:S-layer homology domain-containing protein [Ructibacterium gallinarum]|uniref:S-layer homology domain-containing protein n=1 Tax=Ructibacterium gallinarum TaxID=2779355 RepID=A0A9D5M2Z5_9FIRM|nr:S-layer homology domain-containing protein [Ructibacterium gallinarum]MBE5039704.1 S-layer homology domain-containing protein [Ructibacterium gallinarum]
MKRIICLLIVLCLLGVPVAAEETEAAIETSAETKAVRIIKGLGIMQGYEDGSFRPEGALTRAEFAQCIAAFLGMATDEIGETAVNTAIWENEFHGTPLPEGTQTGEGAETQSALFADLPAGHWAYAAVEKVMQYRIMIGTTEGLFEPDRPVLPEEAVKVMLCLLGYQVNAEVNGGYPAGYLLIANRLDITTGIDLLAESGMTRGQVAQLIYNCLSVQTQAVDQIGTESTQFSPTGKTLMSDFLNIEQVRGEMTDNGVTSYSGRSEIAENQIKIGNITIEVSDTQEEIRTEIGSILEAYYHVDKNGGPNTLVYAEVSDVNRYVFIPAEEIDSFEGNTVSYNENSKTRTQTIAAGTQFIHNGTAVSTLTDTMRDLSSGWIKIMQNGTNLVVMKDYRGVFASSVNTDEGVIYDKLDPSSPIYFNPEDHSKHISIKNKDKTLASTEDLGPSMAMMIADSMYDVEIILCGAAVSGTVEYVAASGEAGVTVSGTFYPFTQDYLNASNKITANLGENVNLFLDTDQKIVWVESGNAAQGTVYGFVVNSVKKDSFDGEWMLKVFTAAGEMNEYNVASRITLNDEQGREYTLKGEEIDAWLAERTGFVEFELNSNQEIRRIVLPLEEGTNGQRLYKIYEITAAEKEMMMYKSYTKNFGYRINVNDSTRVFNIPEDFKNAADDEFSLLTSSFFSDNMTYQVTGYTTVPNSKMAQYLVNYGSGSKPLNNSDKLAVVTDVVQSLNEEGELCNVLYANKAGSEVQLYEGDDCSFDAVPPAVAEASGKTYQIAKGDIIRYGTDARGKVAQIYLVYDADAENPSGGHPGYLPGNTEKYYIKSSYVDIAANENHMYEGISPYGGGYSLPNGNPYGNLGQNTQPAHWFGREQRVMLGYALSRDDVSVTLTTQDMSVYPEYYPNGIPAGAEEEGGYVGVFVTDVIRLDNTRVDVVELRDNDVTVRIGSLSDVVTYADAGKECSKILVASNYGDVVHVIIIQNFRKGA